MSQAAGAPVLNLLEELDLGGGETPAVSSHVTLPLLLSREKGKGLSIRGAVKEESGTIFYDLAFENGSLTSLDGFMIQINKNAFGLVPVSQTVAMAALAPGAMGFVRMPLNFSPSHLAPGGSGIQVAVKCHQLGVLYFSHAVDPLVAQALQRLQA
jgi:AP-1 complex subunit beta-1